MTQPALPATVTPRLGDTLLREIPRFFGGFPSTLQELLQNSLRARATEVDFHLEGRMLTILDNGVGLDDPQVILTAAESGWTTGVVEPAGLGALSALNPEFAVQVTYRSRDWQFTLTPEAFALGVSVPVEAAEPITGFQVTLHLKNVPAVAYMLEQRRGYAPITVRLNGQVVPPKTPRGQRFDTPAGTLYMEPGTYGRRFQAVWEHFPVNADALLSCLVKVGSSTAIALAQSRDFTLVIDPASGIRPKLPDRNALLDDAALHHAAVQLAELLDAYIVEQLRAAVPDLGAQQLSEAQVKEAAKQFGHGVLSAFLTAQGYMQTTLSRPSTVQAYLGHDAEDDSAYGWTHDWVQPSLGVAFAAGTGEQSALSLLRSQGYSVPYGTPDTAKEGTVSIAAQNLRPFRLLTLYETEHRVMLGLADVLTVQGVPVPAYVHVSTGPQIDQESYFLVLGGSIEEAEQYLRAHQADLGGLLLLTLLDTFDLRETDLVEYDERVDATELGDMMLHTFIQAFFPERAQAQGEVARLERVVRVLKAATDALTGVNQVCSGQELETAPCLTWLRHEHQKAQMQIQGLVDQHHLS